MGTMFATCLEELAGVLGLFSIERPVSGNGCAMRQSTGALSCNHTSGGFDASLVNACQR